MALCGKFITIWEVNLQYVKQDCRIDFHFWHFLKCWMCDSFKLNTASRSSFSSPWLFFLLSLKIMRHVAFYNNNRNNNNNDDDNFMNSHSTIALTCPEKNGRFPLGNRCDTYLECVVSLLSHSLMNCGIKMYHFRMEWVRKKFVLMAWGSTRKRVYLHIHASIQSMSIVAHEHFFRCVNS